jgi:hypothetical protein
MTQANALRNIWIDAKIVGSLVHESTNTFIIIVPFRLTEDLTNPSLM